MPQLTYWIPSAGETITKGPERKTLAESNLAKAKGVKSLQFMFYKSPSGGDVLYNKRSSLPTAARIIAFNRKRLAGWHVGKNPDMRTVQEHTFSRAKRPSLKAMKFSRNHKQPDSLLGAKIQRVVISSVLDSPKEAKLKKLALINYARRFLAPLDSIKGSATKLGLFKEKIDELIDGPKNAASFQKRFNAAKRILSASLHNLRIGESGANSGMGESSDPNIVAYKNSASGRSSPISQMLQEADDMHVQEDKVHKTRKPRSRTSVMASFRHGTRLATSSITRR